MKAIVCPKYGSPDVLELNEVEKPVPKDNEVLIKIRAAATNPYDWHIMRGKPFFFRFMMGLQKPKNEILGNDISGIVEEVGSNVKEFKIGDEIFGGIGFGGFAEYVCTTEDKIVLKPTNISFEEAASVPMAALSALQGLQNSGEIKSGQKVLINGASGGVGTFAVQLAKALGAEVTSICSTRNVEKIKSIGSDHVIDYTKEDFTKNGQQYDLIIDNVANLSVSDYKRALTPNGVCAIIGFSSVSSLITVSILAKWNSITTNQKIGILMVNENKKDLTFLKELLETKKIVPVIEKKYPLSEVAEAIRYIEEGHAQGKIVITI